MIYLIYVGDLLPDDAERTEEMIARERQASANLDRYLAGKVTVIGNEVPSKNKRNMVRYPIR
jgi:hypothetical protein